MLYEINIKGMYKHGIQSTNNEKSFSCDALWQVVYADGEKRLWGEMNQDATTY